MFDAAPPWVFASQFPTDAWQVNWDRRQYKWQTRQVKDKNIVIQNAIPFFEKGHSL